MFKKIIGWFKKNKTLSLIISTLITDLISKFIFNFKLLNWIYNESKSILKISVPIWVILICISGFLFLKRVYKNYSSEKILHLDPRNYKADKMFGVICEFIPNAPDLETVNYRCPNCLNILTSENKRRNWPLICKNCGFKSEYSYENLNKKIWLKIDRKIATEEYKKVVGKKPKDFLESEDEIKNKSSQKSQ